MRDWLHKPIIITPERFEQRVKSVIERSGCELQEFSASHRERLAGLDGDYEIDIVARFRALMTTFVVLIECKHHKHPVKRDMVQILVDRLRSTGAQKGMMFTSGCFQSGAIEYARAHGVALVKLTDDDPVIFAGPKPILSPAKPPTRDGAWLISLNGEGEAVGTPLELYDPKPILGCFDPS
jgi:restriction system protein